MADSHGDFIWYELMTTDADAAQAFYGGLLGWTFDKSNTPGMDYRLGSKNGVEIVGLMALTEEMCEPGFYTGDGDNIARVRKRLAEVESALEEAYTRWAHLEELRE